MLLSTIYKRKSKSNWTRPNHFFLKLRTFLINFVRHVCWYQLMKHRIYIIHRRQSKTINLLKKNLSLPAEFHLQYNSSSAERFNPVLFKINLLKTMMLSYLLTSDHTTAKDPCLWQTKKKITLSIQKSFLSKLFSF